MKLPFRYCSLGVSQHLQASCAFVALLPSFWLRAFARKLQSNQATCAPVTSMSDSPTLSHHGHTIEFA